MGTVESCFCDECVRSCRERPGWLYLEQFSKIAEYLNLSVEETFNKYFSIDWWEGYYPDAKDQRGYIIAPAIKGYEGKHYPFTPSGKCALLTEDGKCLIHEVKPNECATSFHEGMEDRTDYRKGIVDSWQTEEGLELLKRCFGTPTLKGPRIIDLLEMLAQLL